MENKYFDSVDVLNVIKFAGFGCIALLLLAVVGYLTALKCLRKWRNRTTWANCWFCHKDVVVPAALRNSFQCPQCEQYNGFTEDGDYDEFIPAMYNEDVNNGKIYTQQLNPAEAFSLHQNRPSLCTECSNNQSLKIKQLAVFIPYNEENFEEEVKNFKQYLEEAYKLCQSCEDKVHEELQRQDGQLQANLIQFQKLEKSSSSSESKDLNPFSVLMRGVIFLRLTIICLAGFLLSMEIFRFFLLKRYYIVIYSNYIYHQKRLLVVTGLGLTVLSSLLSGKYRLRVVDVLCPLLWGILLVFTVPESNYIPALAQLFFLDDRCRLFFHLLCFILCIRLHTSKKVVSRTAPKFTRYKVTTHRKVPSSSPITANSPAKDKPPPPMQESGLGSSSRSATPADWNDGMDLTGEKVPINDGINHLNLGPSMRGFNSRPKDIWTTHTYPDRPASAPPPSSNSSPRPVVFPARFSFVSSSPSFQSQNRSFGSRQEGSAFHRILGNVPTTSQFHLNPPAPFGEESSSSGIGEHSSGEECPVHRRRRPSSRKDGQQGRVHRKTSPSDLSYGSTIIAVLFGVSLGFNIAVAVYFLLPGRS